VKFAIVGSGFGLYGYLPALIGLGHSVVLPQRYQERFFARPELKRFGDHVEWQADEEAALSRAAGVVIAQRPENQREWVLRSLAFPNIDRLVLEKPLAPTPEEAIELDLSLAQSRKAYRVGYTFCGLSWTSRIREFAGDHPTGDLSIDWRFLAHHFHHGLSNWKRWNSAGGGAIRFYGIQLIAALAQSGYRVVSESHAVGPSAAETTGWSAVFSGDGLPNCRILVDCQSEATRFDIFSRTSRGLDATLFQEMNPFASEPWRPASAQLDGRIGAVGDVVRSLFEREDAALAWYPEVLKLWQSVEDQTAFSENGRPRRNR
jgi:predicted dehydrogenase